MNEIHHIHLGRQAYTISADAYKELQDYLEAIKKEVGKEVADEVELRMSELLTERGITGKKVILEKDVNYLKEQLGTPGDFSEAEGDAAVEADAAAGSKRLFRDTSTAMIAGVAAGLAEYFNIDVIIIRLIFIALTFFGGSGILLYAVLWVLVPEVKTNSERLQMQGKPITVEGIKEVVARADVQGATRRAGRIVVPIVQRVARIVLAVVGIALIVCAVLTLLALLTVGLYVWMNKGQMVAGEAIFPVGTKQTILLLSGIAVLVIANLFVLLSGKSMFDRKWPLPGWVTASLAGLLLVSSSLTIALAFDTGHQIRTQLQSIHHTQVTTLQPFTKLKINGKMSWFTYKPSDKYQVSYNYIGKPLKGFVVNSKDGTLTLDTAHATGDPCDFFCLYNDRNLQVTIYAPSLSDISVDGDNNSFTTADPWKQSGVTVSIGSNSSVILNYTNPTDAAVTTHSSDGSETVALTGLRTASDSDTVVIQPDYFSMSRASTVEINTDGACDAPQNGSRFDLLSFPDKLTVNDHKFISAGDLRAAQKANEGPTALNCVEIVSDNP